MRIEDHISQEQEIRVVEAIHTAESRTSGEIKVHLERFCKGDPLDRAKSLFLQLGLHQTERRNGVIIYVALDAHKAAIWGDEGLYCQTDPGFWTAEMDTMLEHFRCGDVAGGLIRAISDIGERLAELFPRQAGDDENPNELSDEVSYG
jgi:uncharacterized membrane protein